MLDDCGYVAEKRSTGMFPGVLMRSSGTIQCFQVTERMVRFMRNNFGYVLATKIVAEKKEKVQFMYREEPDNNEDSGWRFFAGSEGQEYVDNSENINIYDINTILKIDPDIEKYLDFAVGSVFERESTDVDFSPSIGYNFGGDLE